MSASLSLETEFSPTVRLDETLMKAQFDGLMGEGTVAEVLDASPYVAMVTNTNRQIVFANRTFKDLLGMDDRRIRGSRLGELIRCPNTEDHPGGCGSGVNCRFCGLVHVFLESMGSDQRVVRESRMIIGRGERHIPLDVKVTATPMQLAGDRFLMVFMDDISSTKRREYLERTFFHDVMNTAGGVMNLAMYVRETAGETSERAAGLLVDQSRMLIDEIRSQQLLFDAESDNLAISLTDTRTPVLFTEIRTAGEVLREAEGKRIRCRTSGADLPMRVDTVLAKRALLNALKNALEATGDGGAIDFQMDSGEDMVVFRVVNSAVMEESVKSRIFQRSFSTKGRGRGIGTYSLRLIVENFLGGRVEFTSDEGSGTCFTIYLPRLAG